MDTTDYNYHGNVIVWDLDDTLLRERDFCRSGFRWIEHELVRRFGSRMIGLSARMDSHLRRRENYFAFLEKLLGDNFSPEDMSRLVAGYRGHQPERMKLKPEIKNFLNEARSHGIAMAIVTDGRSTTQRSKIESSGLQEYVSADNIYISDEVGYDKTSPESFISIVRKYPEAKGFFYIGDNERKDFLMPNLLGWCSCKVPYDVDNVHPDYISEDENSRPAYYLNSMDRLRELCF